MKEGIILSGIGGLYEVCGPDETVMCKARGLFRKEGIRPLLGDWVRYSEQNYLEEILPRRNQLVRPAVANMDQVLFVMALHNPEPSWSVLEKFLLEAERQDLPVLICLNKADLAQDGEELWREAQRAYGQAGYRVEAVSSRQPETLKNLRRELENRLTVIAGPSGAGKTSLINQLVKDGNQEVGELSRKIARGKNTTRHARLLPLKEGEGWIADTPGFTSFHLGEWTTEELLEGYPEFAPYEGGCRFRDCRHLCEPGCRVREAAERGDISSLRYEAYCQLYREIKEEQERMN